MKRPTRCASASGLPARAARWLRAGSGSLCLPADNRGLSKLPGTHTWRQPPAAVSIAVAPKYSLPTIRTTDFSRIRTALHHIYGGMKEEAMNG